MDEEIREAVRNKLIYPHSNPIDEVAIAYDPAETTRIILKNDKLIRLAF